MKSLKSYITEHIVTEEKSPRGTRGYIALVKWDNGETDLRTFKYDSDPQKAVEKELNSKTARKFDVIEGPRILTLKGYKFYCDDYNHWNMCQNDNGYTGGNYDLDQMSAEEAWEKMKDPKNKLTKEI